MHFKSSFLNGIQEDVYIKQPEGFIDKDKKIMICKLHKEVYSLKQEPSTWYERIYSYLTWIGFIITIENSNLYLKTKSRDKVLLAEIFDDDIIFGENELICR